MTNQERWFKSIHTSNLKTRLGEKSAPKENFPPRRPDAHCERAPIRGGARGVRALQCGCRGDPSLELGDQGSRRDLDASASGCRRERRAVHSDFSRLSWETGLARRASPPAPPQRRPPRSSPPPRDKSSSASHPPVSRESGCRLSFPYHDPPPPRMIDPE